jgi:RNA polymerase sigma factor (sigma-70 family)
MERASATDPELVARAVEGDENAWSALVRRYADAAHAVARRAGLDDAASADVVQETFVALWRSLRRLRDTGRLFGWIVTSARRAAWRAGRRGRAAARRERSVAREERAAGPTPDEALEALEEEQVLREALVEIGERCRRLLTALYLDAEPAGYDDVADRLGIPRGSIGPTRGRCLEKLRRALDGRGFGPAIRVSERAGTASRP